MAIPQLKSSLEALMQANQDSTRLGDKIAATAETTGNKIIEASKDVEIAVDAQVANAKKENAAIQQAEMRLTGGIAGERLIQRYMDRAFLAAQLKIDTQEQEANRGGVEKLWDNVIKHGTGSTPGQRVIADLDVEVKNIQGTIANLRAAADNSISLFKTAYNSSADDVAAITAAAKEKQAAAGIRANAQANISQSQMAADQLKAGAAKDAVTARLQLNSEARQAEQAARQLRMDNFQIEKFKADEIERKAKVKSVEQDVKDEMALNAYLAQQTGLPEYAISQMPPDKKTTYGIVLRANEAGQPIAPEVFEKNPELKVLAYNQAQKSTPVRLDTLLPYMSGVNGRYVQVLDKSTNKPEPRLLMATDFNPLSYTNAPKFLTGPNMDKIDETVTPYMTVVAPTLDAITYGEDAKDGKASKGVPNNMMEIVLTNPEVVAATKTEIGQYWLNQVATDGGSEEGLLQEAKKSPTGLLDLFRLKSSLALAGTKLIPGNLMGHEVEPTIPVTVYSLDEGGWTGQMSMNSRMGRIPVGQKGLQEWFLLQEKNERIEQEYLRAKQVEAFQANTSIFDPYRISGTKKIMAGEK